MSSNEAHSKDCSQYVISNESVSIDNLVRAIQAYDAAVARQEAREYNNTSQANQQNTDSKEHTNEK